MHADPPMVEELAQGFYPKFEAKWRVAEVVGRALMLCVAIAAIAGVLGGGPVGVWTRTIGSGRLHVEYQPVARFGTPTSLDIALDLAPDQKQADVTLAGDVAKGFGLQSVTPQPAQWQPGPEGMRLLFDPAPGSRHIQIHVGGMPISSGRLDMTAGVDGQQPLRWAQYVLP